MLRKDITTQRYFISSQECFGLTFFPIYIISHTSTLAVYHTSCHCWKEKLNRQKTNKKPPKTSQLTLTLQSFLPKESNEKDAQSRKHSFQLPPHSCLRWNGFILVAGRLLIASMPSTLPQDCPVHPIHIRRSKWVAESSRVQQLLLWMSLQIWERQEHEETSLIDDRNCKGQPIALTQSGHCGPTCIFIITSRDLPEMKEEPVTALSNQSINSFCFVPVLFNQYN